ncbi:uncharacterized protein IL334_000574 [Kwoniella shivajii]|uniref:Cyclase n=1 Tax=Kwoniella shivajii TaxID=564305 RepID=A0ABZ1CSJ9_9TREE|nr:hypothetical protein IL334_000574 [Kwoniella shivajii]
MASVTRSTDSSLLSLDHLTPSDHPDHPYSSWPSLPANPIGRLVLLTPKVTKEAASLIASGKRFSLDWSVYPSGARMYSRACSTHRIARVDNRPLTKEIAEKEGKTFQPCFDDFIEINTQSSTQWDYFLHYSYPKSGFFYNGLTVDEIKSEQTGEIGIAAIARAGGVQTRALLVDIPLYLSAKGLPPNPPLSNPPTTQITLTVLQDALKHFNLTPRVGDMLIVRTGFQDVIEERNAATARGEEEKQFESNWWGVEQSEEVVEWIWKTGFVAIGSDNPTFENWPVTPEELHLHPILLSGMGIMIGELLRLNEIAVECKRLNRWEFFFSSTPLMVEHGVASPPNAVAIF